jgi:signal transducing adaptor molecule
VKALYDFEAAEDNEITFKSGDIIIIIDDSDQHWWKGINNGDEGLFPANFVTKDLQQQVHKKPELNTFVQDLNPEQKPQNEISNKQIIIDESLINHCLAMLQHGAIETNSNDMRILEDSCYAMGPLIDHELERVDRKHMQLLEINKNLLEVMDLYHHLMEEGRRRATQVKPITNQMYQPRPDLQSMPYAPFSGYYVDPNLHQHMMHSMPSAQQ